MAQWTQPTYGNDPRPIPEPVCDLQACAPDLWNTGQYNRISVYEKRFWNHPNRCQFYILKCVRVLSDEYNGTERCSTYDQRRCDNSVEQWQISIFHTHTAHAAGCGEVASQLL